jgi:hypothetical protein
MMVLTNLLKKRFSIVAISIWTARLEMCQWRRERLDKESLWDEGRSTN